MRVNQRTFETMLNREMDKIRRDHEGSFGTAIGITLETENDSRQIQRALFELGYMWPNSNGLGRKFQDNLRSLFVRPIPNSLTADTTLTALEQQEMGGSIEYIVLPVTGISIRCNNFE